MRKNDDQRHRGRDTFAAALKSAYHWGANFVVTVSFLTLLSAIGDDGTFFLFGVLTLLALAYFYKQVPETKNRTLPQIERDMGRSPDTLGEPAPAHPAAA